VTQSVIQVKLAGPRCLVSEDSFDGALGRKC